MHPHYASIVSSLFQAVVVVVVVIVGGIYLLEYNKKRKQ